MSSFHMDIFSVKIERSFENSSGSLWLGPTKKMTYCQRNNWPSSIEGGSEKAGVLANALLAVVSTGAADD
jgi:hypothetical protein